MKEVSWTQDAEGSLRGEKCRQVEDDSDRVTTFLAGM